MICLGIELLNSDVTKQQKPRNTYRISIQSQDTKHMRKQIRKQLSLLPLGGLQKDPGLGLPFDNNSQTNIDRSTNMINDNTVIFTKHVNYLQFQTLDGV